MSIKSLYPNIRPSLNLDFANTKVLDQRITFSRASTATYYDGKSVSKSEENLITESQLLNGSSWQSPGLTITGSQTAPDGTSTAYAFTENAVNETHRIYKSYGWVSGRTYTISFFAKYANRRYVQLNTSSFSSSRVIFDIQNGNVSDPSGAVSTSVVYYGNNWYRFSATITATGTVTASFPIGGNSTSTGNGETYTGNGLLAYYLWGVQVEERSAPAAYTPTTTLPITKYQPTLLTTSTNAPRFDHNPTTGESLGLLIEEQRTNLWQNSSDLTITASPLYVNWSPATRVANTSISPDGTLSADTFYGSSPTASIVSRFSASAGTTYTFSIYLKKDPISNNTNLNYFGYIISWSNNGTTLTDYTSAELVVGQSTLTSLTNEWKRFSVSYTCPTGATSMEFGISNRGQGSGDQGYTVLCWGAQIEAGSFATSYIPTSGSTVTRAADTAYMTGTNFSSWYNNTKGALYIESQNDYNANAHAGTGVEIHSASFQNNMFAFNSKRDGSYYGSPWFDIFTPGGGAGVIGNGVIGGGSNRISGSAFYKSSFSWSFGDTLATSADGTTTGSAALTISPPVVTILGFAANYYAYDPFNGRIKKLIYYPTSLTNTQLQSLTQP